MNSQIAKIISAVFDGETVEMVGGHPMVSQSMRRVSEMYWPYIVGALGIAFLMGHFIAFTYVSMWAIEAWEWINF